MKPLIVQNIVESLSVGLIVVETDGEICLVNETAGRILGYSPAFMQGKGWAEIFFEANPHLEFNSEFNQTILDVIYQKEIRLNRKVPYKTPQGKVRHLAMTASFLREGDAFAGIVVLIDDLTELYVLHQREKDILTEKNRIQRERSESLNKLALAVAHQIRNPLVSIGGFANRLRKTLPSDARTAAYVSRIIDGAKRLEAVVRAVHDYATLPQANPKPVNVPSIMTELRGRLDRAAETLSRTIIWTCGAFPETLCCDRALLLDALYQVGINAVEFCDRPKVVIGISCLKQRDGVVISIIDRGPGIPEKAIPFVFDPFFTTKPVGVGMGLTKARRIIVEHGGEIHLQSAIGEGTTVDIRLPHQQVFRDPR